MTDNIAANKGTNSVYEYSNSFDTSSSSSSANVNIDNNVLQFSKLNGDSGQESGTNSGTNDKKSFHITSVTVQHNSTDGNADESADESRTEELSDNVDSMSAVDHVQTDVAADLIDIASRKDDVLYKVTSVGSAPIIPTSAQYGIAVVSGVNNGELSDVNKFLPSDCKFSDTVKRTEFIANGLENNCANVVAKELNTQIKNERFKVVKIESNEPFKRGRWVCMDFSDQSMDQVKKSAIHITSDNDKCAKKETPDKEISPSEILVNGTLMENISNDNESKPAQNAQLADSTYHNGDMSGMNSVSPNQTYNAPFMPPSSVNQPQAQSLTHIIIPQSTPSQVASGSYGHSQSLPHAELQHVHQAAAAVAAAAAQQQQQPIHVVSSLQQSFHAAAPPQQQQQQQPPPQQQQHSSIQHPQNVMQHMGAVQQQQQQQQQQPPPSQQPQQSDNVYNQQQQQPTQSASMSVQQQQQPLLQQQYQTMQQNTALNQTPNSAQCNQRGAAGSQPQQQLNMTQMPSQQTSQQNGTETLMGVNQTLPQQQQQQQQSQQFQQPQNQGQQGQAAGMQQTLQQQQQQHTMQQVPMQQQSFQHAIPPQQSSQQQQQQQQQQPIIHQQQPVQAMPPTQHHSPQQANQPSVQSMPTQQQIPQQTSGAQASSQPSLPPTNLQQPVMQQGVVQQQKVPPPSASVQYLPQQAAIQQPNQQSGAPQPVLNAPQQQQQQQQQPPPQMMQQQMPTGTDPTQQLHMQQMQQQQQPQQQILSQPIPQQQQPPQQIPHIPQPTPQIPQQTQPQQVPMQQPQIAQQIPAHHQPIIQSIPPQQAPQQPQQMMQTQNMPQTGAPPQTSSFQNVPQQQPQQPQQTQPSQQAAQVMQQMPQTMQQMPPQPQQQPIQSTQSIQHSFPQQQQQPPPAVQQMTPLNGGQQTMQPAYQTSVPHQNVSNQMSDQNIPVSGSQAATYQQQQHDVVMSNVNQQQTNDVLLSNVQSQYSINQPQNISVQTQLPLHVSLHQSYQNTPSSNYVNSSNMNMMCNTSMSQQTPPISQPQFYTHSGTSGSITSQDLQQLCGHQHHQPAMPQTSVAVNPNVSSLVTQTPLISTVPSQSLPPTMEYMMNTAPIPAHQNGSAAATGQIPYSVHYQNGSSVGSASSVQTQTTPISQPCSSSSVGAGVPLQQYIQQTVPAVLSSGAAQVPVSSSYSPNISVVHPIQIQQRYVQNNPPAATATNQMYPTGHPVPFTETSISTEHYQPNVYLPEQVVVEIKQQDEGLRQDDSDKI
ncbi:putative uncharacterized protein DDB_G0271606 isoform X2 [Planococcus citri]|uniref:putative uncharacterized protein DDB_G0271606 isoform X2 n=1 Tax=Planococcus citri TaxID=170843 RepID=UPI0031F74AA7